VREHARRPPFPYTTLFRSGAGGGTDERRGGAADGGLEGGIDGGRAGAREEGFTMSCSKAVSASTSTSGSLVSAGAPGSFTWDERSEEHTSELQSRENLVCR